MKDYNGNEIKCYGDFESCGQMTVGELRKRLKEYSDDAVIYIESSNTGMTRSNTIWSQILLYTYPCKEIRHDSKRNGNKALMLVGDWR